MKKEEKIILNEIFNAISGMRAELSRLEELVSGLASGVEDEEPAPVVAAPAAEAEPVPFADDFDMPGSFEVEEIAVAEPEPETELVAEPEPAAVPGTAGEALACEADEPEFAAIAVEKPKARKAVVDAMLTEEAWRTDMPSSEVKDIRSAIALNDRILVINKLFGGDAENFQDAVAALNSMSSLDEAVDFLKERYPDWKWNSDIVYRFMMAVRRRIR